MLLLQASLTLFTAAVMFYANGWEHPWSFAADVAIFFLFMFAAICASDAYLRWQWSCAQRNEETGRQQQSSRSSPRAACMRAPVTRISPRAPTLQSPAPHPLRPPTIVL